MKADLKNMEYLVKKEENLATQDLSTPEGQKKLAQARRFVAEAKKNQKLKEAEAMQVFREVSEKFRDFENRAEERRLAEKEAEAKER